ncbi:MAG: hypothetical protein AAFY59_01865 [Pseudomonadota bacterium]
MKNWQALLVIALAVGFFWIDEPLLGFDALTWAGKQLLRVTHWLAFWR